jgi:hypothetical protein
MKKGVLILALLLAGAGGAAQAQEPVTNPSVTHLMKTYGIAKDEAQMRVGLQNEILELSERLNTENDPAYGDIFIKHEPVYKIVVSFADKADRKPFLESLDPKIRRYVQLRTAKKSRGLAARELEEINAALRPLSLAYGARYNLESERFVITVENAAAVERVRAALPDTRKVETVVEVGLVPKVEAVPTGVQAGDRLYGGKPVRDAQSSTAGYCSFGYGVNYTVGGVAKKGILTAGHCPNTMYVDFGGRFVTLSGPLIDKPHRDSPPPGNDNISDKYDYQIWETTGLTVDNTIYFRDDNSIPEFPATGTLRMTAITGFMNQKMGMVVCKSGHTTGITCGEIVNGNATHDGVAGWIEVSKTQQRDISEPGDSGGPWFLYPGTSTTITGVGIHTAGAGTGTGWGSYAIYMPIDYIDDHITSVNTIKQ